MPKASVRSLSGVVSTFVLLSALVPTASVAEVEAGDVDARSRSFEPFEARCGAPTPAARAQRYGVVPDPSDCSVSQTDPSEEYAPDEVWEVPVVVHVLMDSNCDVGALSDEIIQSQMEVLNEDFRAIYGSPGEFGNDSRLDFVLASVDPDGSPTDGITRSCNDVWHVDGGDYWESLAWDPHRYMNVYTVEATFGGYVPFFPADGGGVLVGGADDRVVVNWRVFGRDPWVGPPNDEGRTFVHEVGHYLGLEHTFIGGCADAEPPGCYTSGDMICDTASESIPTGSDCEWGEKVSCGSIDPTDNYMDYSDDRCLRRFTVEQVRRTRCTLLFYRPDLFTATGPGPAIDIQSIVPGVAGVANDWRVSGVTPSGNLRVVCNLREGPDQVTVGDGTAGPDGNAVVTRNVPPSLAGETVECRAFDAATRGQSLRFVQTFATE